MTERDAAETLQGAELLPILQGPISDIKRVISECLEADIPVAGGMPPGAGKG